MLALLDPTIHAAEHILKLSPGKCKIISTQKLILVIKRSDTSSWKVDIGLSFPDNIVRALYTATYAASDPWTSSTHQNIVSFETDAQLKQKLNRVISIADSTFGSQLDDFRRMHETGCKPFSCRIHQAGISSSHVVDNAKAPENLCHIIARCSKIDEGFYNRIEKMIKDSMDSIDSIRS